jgi:hypothetical protein
MDRKAIALGRAAQAAVLVALLVGTRSGTALAQNIQTYFPSGVGGYDQQLGVTVLSRARPLYEAPGIRLGGIVLQPQLDESLFYNSDVTGIAGSGSWGSKTAGSISANSDWERNAVAALAGFAHNRFFAFPGLDYTDWNVGIGSGYTIRDSLLEGAYSHQTYHQFGTAIGAVQSSTPASVQTDTAHVDYTFNLSRFAITPDISASAYRYGEATVQGQRISQSFLNRNVLAATVVGRYSMSEEGGLLVVVRGIVSNFTNPQAGQPSNNSRSFEILGGIDHQADAVWRYRALVGVEVRTFEAAQFPSHTAPVIEASVIWTPTGLTTVTGTLSREIEDPQSAGTNGYVLTSARGVVDHELKRNILLQVRGGVQNAVYLQTGGGTQTSLSFGAGVTWLINRNVRLSLDYDFTNLLGSSNTSTASVPGSVTGSPFTQSIAMLTLHVAL